MFENCKAFKKFDLSEYIKRSTSLNTRTFAHFYPVDLF